MFDVTKVLGEPIESRQNLCASFTDIYSFKITLRNLTLKNKYGWSAYFKFVDVRSFIFEKILKIIYLFRNTTKIHRNIPRLRWDYDSKWDHVWNKIVQSFDNYFVLLQY